MSLCRRPCVSQCVDMSVLQALCQCVDMSLCCRSCVSQCVDTSLCCRPCVSVLTCLCVAGPVSVSVLACLCVAGPVSVCWSSKPAGGSGQVPVSGQDAVHSLSPLLTHSSPPVPLVTSPCCCTSVVHSGAWVVCYEPADSVVAAHCSRCCTLSQYDGRCIRPSAGPVSVPCKYR